MVFNKKSSIGIVGAGKLGSALVPALLATGYNVEMIASRQIKDADKVSSLFSTVSSTTVDHLIQKCEVVFLAVPDEYVSELASSLSWHSQQAVIHLSGTLDLEVLFVAKKSGAHVGCLHPIQTFLKNDTPSQSIARFNNIVCGIESEPPLDIWLLDVVRSLGSSSVRLENIDRALYHSATVFASNYVVALLSAASRAWVSSGLPASEGKIALQNIMRSSIDNLTKNTFVDAITGPIIRGDCQTVEAHLKVLEAEPELRKLYSILGLELLLTSKVNCDTKIKITELLESNK